jgi:Archaea-specific RecJ-like exonuclease, contains DnaJ-type Zn finger domain
MSETPKPTGDAPVVFDLTPSCTTADLTEGAAYHAVVDGVVAYGIFVELTPSISGLIHESVLERSHDVGDRLTVTLSEIRDNGDLSFTEFDVDSYETVVVEHTPEITAIAELTPAQQATIDARVIQTRQTGGPTLFRVTDGTGIAVASAFTAAGVRAYPAVEVGDVVRISGTMEEHAGTLQLEVDSLERLDAEAQAEHNTAIDAAIADRASVAEFDPLIEWPAFDPLFDELVEVATQLRRYILEGRPVVIRHHADGDGMCGAVPLEHAIRSLMREVYPDPDTARHLLRRHPSKAPYYELEDVTRDLQAAREAQERHGQQMPVLVMLDNGSTEEDVPAYRHLAHYDVPTLVIDHHHPDPEAVDPLVDAHINPYLHGEDYRITTGMMSVELARAITPAVTPMVRHVPAVAGLMDRSKDTEAMAAYRALAAEAGYTPSDLGDIGEALDYLAYWLRYHHGAGMVETVLGVGAVDETQQAELVGFLAAEAAAAVDEQLTAIGDAYTERTLASGARLATVDLDAWTHRFTYPPPGKTTGKLHDQLTSATDEPVITIGIGPDFAVMRSDGVRLDIPTMVAELDAEIAGGGVNGGGHLVVGSIKFVPGRREEVITALTEKMADAPLDAAIGTRPQSPSAD